MTLFFPPKISKPLSLFFCHFHHCHFRLQHCKKILYYICTLLYFIYIKLCYYTILMLYLNVDFGDLSDFETLPWKFNKNFLFEYLFSLWLTWVTFSYYTLWLLIWQQGGKSKCFLISKSIWTSLIMFLKSMYLPSHRVRPLGLPCLEGGSSRDMSNAHASSS